jgi:predicted GTPase
MIDTQGNNEIDLDKMDNKNGILINGQHPVFGSKKVDEIKGRKNKLKLDIYNYPDNIEIISDEESIAILFIGQSGTGKSTFINAYVNHLLGISFNDSIRYKLIFGDKNKVKDQTQSQTDKISVYNIRSPQYKNRLFKLIDTPGAGDTRNQNDQSITDLEKDKMEKEFLIMYNDLFSKQIGQLNSIVFVVKASENGTFKKE